MPSLTPECDTRLCIGNSEAELRLAANEYLPSQRCARDAPIFALFCGGLTGEARTSGRRQGRWHVTTLCNGRGPLSRNFATVTRDGPMGTRKASSLLRGSHPRVAVQPLRPLPFACSAGRRLDEDRRMTSRKRKNLTFEQLQPHFGRTLKDAAAALDLSVRGPSSAARHRPFACGQLPLLACRDPRPRDEVRRFDPWDACRVGPQVNGLKKTCRRHGIASWPYRKVRPPPRFQAECCAVR